MKKSPMWVLTKKEIKELLRDPKVVVLMLVVPALLFVVMGQVMGFAISETVKSATKGQSIAVINNDTGNLSLLFIQMLKTMSNNTVDVLTGANNVTEVFHKKSYDFAIVIPSNFSSSIISGIPAKISVFYSISDFSISSLTKTGVVSSITSAFRDLLTSSLLSQAYPGMNISSVLNPLVAEQYAFIGGNILPGNVLESMMSGLMVLFIVPMLVFSIGSSISAAGMGTEKEEKTLEALLTFPVKRSYILFSKTLGSLVVSLLGVAGMGLGALYYYSRIFSFSGQSFSISSVASIMSAKEVALLLFAFFIAILLVLTISTVLSSFAKNIREAQMVASYVWMPVLLPFFILMYVDFSQLGSLLSYLLSVFPASVPIVAIKTLFMANKSYLYLSFISNLIYIAIALYLGTKWFSGETLIAGTGMRRKLRSKRF